MGAVESEVFRLLARQHVELTRDVILLAVADEEVSEGGMKLLTEQHWRELDCGHMINEGGLGIVGMLAPNQTTYAISVGEKGILWLRVKATGEAGHGSTPTDIRAPPHLVDALAKLNQRKVAVNIQPSMFELLRRVGAKNGGLNGFVMQRPLLVNAFAVSKLMSKPTTKAVVTDTCQVTGFEGKGSAPNVIPSETSAIIDCRLLPGTTPEALQKELEELVKGVPGISFEVITAFEAQVSETDDAFFDALARNAVRGHANAVAGPTISPGYTDSVLARKLGTRAYGFVPFEVTQEELATFHGRDERVKVDTIKHGVEILFRAVTDVAAAP